MMELIEKTRVLALFGALVSASAAAREPSVAVLAMDNCEVTVAPHARNFRQALESRLGGDVQSEATTMSKLGASASGVSLAEVERLLSGATADLFEGQVERAARTLADVVGDIERLPPTPARYRAFTDVVAALGHIQLRRGKRGEAESAKYYERILRVDPTWQPSINLYAPSTIAFVARLRQKVANEAKVTIRITTRPAGRPVFVDTHQWAIHPLLCR